MSVLRLLLDTNVVLDLLLARSEFDKAAVILATKAAQGEIVAYLSATSVTTVHYIARKTLGSGGADLAVSKLLDLFHVAPVTDVVLRSALARAFDDFEDAVIDAAAEHVGVDAIVTRDAAGFKSSSHRVFTPPEMVQALMARG